MMTKKEIMSVLQKLLGEIQTEEGRTETLRRLNSEQLIGTNEQWPFMVGVCEATIEMILNDGKVVL